MSKTNYTRTELIDLCNKAVVQQENWSNRDTASAQRQVGELLFLLSANCEFFIEKNGDIKTNERTIWIEVHFRGFGNFSNGGKLNRDVFYLPTPKRIDDAQGGDWY